jgi:hypothetical protein
MVKITAGLVQRAVKRDWKYEVKNFLVHAAKVLFNFGFRKSVFGFFNNYFIKFAL